MEPNPRSRPVLQSLRTCEVVSACVWANETNVRFANGAELAAMTNDETLLPSEPYSMETENSADTYFEARCAPLHNLLVEVMATQHPEVGVDGRPVIDLLSVDAEGAEVDIFKDFPFRVWDIRAIVVETSRRTSMAIDGLLLPHGFVKIAVLGKDAVYVSLSQAALLPTDRLKLPNRIAWNEPGTEADTIEYMRFQRYFGVEGDLDVDVGDQRLLNETEMDRQRERTEKDHANNAIKLKQQAQKATIGGEMSEKQRQVMEEPWVQEALRDPQVKEAILFLTSDDEAEDTVVQQLVERLRSSARLKAKIVSLLGAGVLVHKGLAKALGVEVP